ncbi:superoxide dismutase family protein [Cellulomonas sp. ATA003]|uniref:superoxide dismutase family protein n=1 Tax=Cellulomonas sp. ATA003 TaxID=3073064 RepID=UPI002872C21F|nr:superoxide dismutase family protein [Cellulomonas sp. ATA003]WNB86478.1 superoxide dismutase family protein [Cellulomonas sp. ATA003]
MLAVAVLAAPALAVTAPAVAHDPLVHDRGQLTDLQPTMTTPTDGAHGSVSAWRTSRGTTVVLRLRGLDRDSAGQAYGAHVHVGHCVAGDPMEAGPHYNSTGQPPVTVSDQTEVWLDFSITPGGTALAIADVPFTIAHGAAHSVVVHAMTTAPDGGAGARIACLPVHF